MKFKSLVLGCCLALCSTAFAGIMHPHAPSQNSTTKSMRANHFCGISIESHSHSEVNFFGVYPNNDTLAFVIYPNEVHDIEMDCYSSMHVLISDRYGQNITNRTVFEGETIYIEDYLNSNLAGATTAVAKQHVVRK